jgi:hypothetical protein
MILHLLPGEDSWAPLKYRRLLKNIIYWLSVLQQMEIVANKRQLREPDEWVAIPTIPIVDEWK